MTTPEPFARPSLGRSRPNRSAGGFYRASADNAQALGGIPLQSAEDAVTAAVRLAYRVADDQVDRSARLAQRLRTAGERATGPDVEKRALDSAEALVFKSMMTGLSWLEGVAAEPGSPIKRFVQTEYDLLGSLLGIARSAGSAGRARRGQRPQRTRMGDPSMDEAPVPDSPAAPEPAPAPETLTPAVYLEGKEPRAVEVLRFELVRQLAGEVIARLRFFPVEGATRSVLVGSVSFDPPRLQLKTTARAPSGVWRAALCVQKASAGDPAALVAEQVGLVEIRL